MFFNFLQRAILIGCAINLVEVAIAKLNIASRKQNVVVNHSVAYQNTFGLGSLGKQEFSDQPIIDHIFILGVPEPLKRNSQRSDSVTLFGFGGFPQTTEEPLGLIVAKLQFLQIVTCYFPTIPSRNDLRLERFSIASSPGKLIEHRP